MMSRWAIYNTATGLIDRVYSGPESEAAIQLLSGEGFTSIADGLDDRTAYVQDGVAIARPPFPITISKSTIDADGIDECLITGVPAGTEVTWPDGQTDIVNDGEVAFAVDLPGEYILKFSAVPYLTQEVAIEAIPAT